MRSRVFCWVMLCAPGGARRRRKTAVCPELECEWDACPFPRQTIRAIVSRPVRRGNPAPFRIFITSSDGGAVGTWRVDVYLVEPEGVRKVDVISAVRTHLRDHYPACATYQGTPICSDEVRHEMNSRSDWVNVAGVRWVDSSQELIVGALVPNSSGYGAKMDEWLGYLIEIPSGKILQRYSRSEFRKRWQSLTGKWN